MPYGSEGQRYFESTKTSRASNDMEPDFPNSPRRNLDLRRILENIISRTPLRRFVHNSPEPLPEKPQSPQQQ